MRIVAGHFRGRRLHSPKGDRIRPTTDRVREAIFSIIASKVPDAQVLDLYAGTGALGLEAISRGASRVVFVDRDPAAVRLIRSNIELCGAGEHTRVIPGPVPKVIDRLVAEKESFDIIFMDPPYGKDTVEKALSRVGRVARDSALVVAEHHAKDVLPSSCGLWWRIRERLYGDTAVTFYTNSPDIESGADFTRAR